jgi:uncharacterized membrane protein YhaH (DUF805 family)
LFSPDSVTDFVVNFIALVASAANFVFVFWAMLVLTPTRITSLRWFWWISLLFLLAAIYTGIQAELSEQTSLMRGYFLWVAALILMLVAPVVSRLERTHRRRNGNKKRPMSLSGGDRKTPGKGLASDSPAR